MYLKSQFTKKTPQSEVPPRMWLGPEAHLTGTLLTSTKIATASIITTSPHEVSRSSAPAWYKDMLFLIKYDQYWAISIPQLSV